MKKIAAVLFIVLVFTVNAFAAESIVWSTYGDTDSNLEVISTITASATGTVTTTALQNSAGIEINFMGMYLYSISTYYGSPAPTVNSDLWLNEHSATGYDVLAGSGVDMIDAATNNIFLPISATAPPLPVFGKLYQKITQATAVTNDAVFVIVYRFIRRCP
jgi:hypothetical protein